MGSKSEILKLPGTRLYYEVRGSGPVLLMIPGGPADAGVFAGIASILADRYTGVAYDPRGNSSRRRWSGCLTVSDAGRRPRKSTTHIAGKASARRWPSSLPAPA